jgi:hypothetical protein
MPVLGRGQVRDLRVTGFAGTGEPTFCWRLAVVVGVLPFGIFLGTMLLENCFFIASPVIATPELLFNLIAVGVQLVPDVPALHQRSAEGCGARAAAAPLF